MTIKSEIKDCWFVSTSDIGPGMPVSGVEGLVQAKGLLVQVVEYE